MRLAYYVSGQRLLSHLTTIPAESVEQLVRLSAPTVGAGESDRVNSYLTTLRPCYCLCMLDHRMQVLLDRTRYEKVVREAKRRHSSVASVIRDAIDSLPEDRVDRRRAVDAILAAAPMEVPEKPVLFRRELDERFTLPT